jgi:hypothetical protein
VHRDVEDEDGMLGDVEIGDALLVVENFRAIDQTTLIGAYDVSGLEFGFDCGNC